VVFGTRLVVPAKSPGKGNRLSRGKTAQAHIQVPVNPTQLLTPQAISGNNMFTIFHIFGRFSTLDFYKIRLKSLFLLGY
jgi:hypothetical protein